MSDRLVAALEQTWGGIVDLLGRIEGGDWSRHTPCAEWDVKDLAAHLGAIESFFQGMPQPAQPPRPTDGIDDWTAAGVAARRPWSVDGVLAEIGEASQRQLDGFRRLDADGWDEETAGPVGPTTRRGLADLRLFDLYIHLLDLRTALDEPLAFDREPDACEMCVERALTLTPWGAVKKAGLPDGARVRLDLGAPVARQVELVVEGGRGRLEEAAGSSPPDDHLTGPAPAYLLVAAGRPEIAEAAGGVVATGANAARLVEGYRIFS